MPAKKKPETPWEAVDAGDLKTLQELIKAGDDVNVAEDEDTPLAKAAEMGRIDLLKELIEAGADVNFGGIWVPLCAAVRSGNAEIVQTLLAAGATVDAQEEEGSTALMQAVSMENFEMVKLLIKAGADPKLEDADGETAFSGATEGSEIYEYLKPFVGEVRATKKTKAASSEKSKELVAAAEAGKLDKVRQLLSEDAAVDGRNDKRDTALVMAATKGHEMVVDELLKAGATVDLPDQYDRTSLWHAAKRGLRNIAEKLLSAGADINAKETVEGKTPFLASISGKAEGMEMMRLLARNGARLDVVDNYGRTALGLAERELKCGEWSSDEEIANARALRELFIEVGLVHRDASDFTAAAAAGDLKQVQEFIESGVPVDAIDEYERTALYMAISRQHQDIVAYLLKSGADVHKPIAGDPDQDVGWGGFTKPCPKCAHSFAHGLPERKCPKCGHQFSASKEYWNPPYSVPMFISWSNRHLPLMTAAKMGNADVVRMLIEAGAAVDRGYGSITPLMVTCYYGHLDAAKVLISFGADPNQQGKTPGRAPEKVSAVQIAAQYKHAALVELLWASGVPAPSRNQTLLVNASEKGEVTAIEKLLQQGADPNGQDPITKEWPLLAAAQKCQAQSVKLLLDKGAIVNPPRQMSPVLLAVTSVTDRLNKSSTLPDEEIECAVETIRLLIGAGAKANPSFFGLSPLSLAQEAKCQPLIKVLEEAIAKEKSAKKKR